MSIFSQQEQRVAHFLLSRAEWEEGTQEVGDLSGKMRRETMMSLSLPGATNEQYKEAIKVLGKKFQIGVYKTHSKSMGNIDVLRVDKLGPVIAKPDNVERLRLARHLAKPTAWKVNHTQNRG